ncbi:hypothetical protein PSMK_25350 [Phycisphaera mikurensis NBRC 102666]|uniref:Uncharacterized protein n=1 Tax=Phycisphaera mikurensis (strain NBRC 102666 / KCTC 22515 / FYK2301M01) TaxID=1142394 RepID=I0IHF6_PHYMF|nr:hypothetical protein PSMK_25350 [Phycisphaera mikurensis NBRC 102666]
MALGRGIGHELGFRFPPPGTPGRGRTSVGGTRRRSEAALRTPRAGSSGRR